MTAAPSSSDSVEHDVNLIRPPMRAEEFGFRGHNLTPGQRRRMRKALRSFHTLETMAATVYRFQIGGQSTELNRQLIAAMCNEMTHWQDFQVKLYEYGLRPSKLRWAFWVVGMVLGLGSRVLGERSILKVGVWVETKAVHHYAQLLQTVDWDPASRAIIEKDQADEQGHINRWRTLLASL